MSAMTRMLAWLLALIVVTLPVVAVLTGQLAPERWPIRQLAVTAEYQRIDEEQIREVVAAHLGRGYFDTDPGLIRSALAQLPWAERVEVRKRWPDRIEVTLVEHQAVARWGDARILSGQGELFEPPDMDGLSGLPRLDGPDEHSAEVMAFFELARQQLSPLGWTLEGAQLSRRGSWRLQLRDGGWIVIGRGSDVGARLARLVRAMPDILADENRVPARIDLRYTNGFVVRWDAPSRPEAAKPDGGEDMHATGEASPDRLLGHFPFRPGAMCELQPLNLASRTPHPGFCT